MLNPYPDPDILKKLIAIDPTAKSSFLGVMDEVAYERMQREKIQLHKYFSKASFLKGVASVLSIWPEKLHFNPASLPSFEHVMAARTDGEAVAGDMKNAIMRYIEMHNLKEQMLSVLTENQKQYLGFSNKNPDISVQPV